jgi:hypothetical protein
MTSSAVAVQDNPIDIGVVEAVITGGDLGKLSPQQRVQYYIQTCESLKLNWRTKPFDVVSLRGSSAKTLYPNKGCAEQLAGLHHISVKIIHSEIKMGIAIDTAEACLSNGRCVTKKGAVPIEGLKGENLANAIMKVETKAHRRAVLALVGLNMPDESEMDTIPNSQFFTVDTETGEITDAPVEREKAPGRTQPTSNGAKVIEPTPIAAGNKATKEQIMRITMLFDDLEYEKGQRRPTLAQLVGQPDPLKLTTAQAKKVIAALEVEFDEKFEYIGHDGVERRERTPKPDGLRDPSVIDVEVIDANEIDWDAAKPEGMSQSDWDELMDPAAAGGGRDWTTS